MPHEDNSHTHLDILDDFSPVQMDPIFTAVFEKMKIYNDLLFSEAVSEERIVEIMQELDSEWQGLLGDEMLITGAVTFMDEDSLDTVGSMKRDFFESHPMKFGGVLPVVTRVIHSSGSLLDEDLKVYQLELRLIREGITTEGKLVTMHGSAKVDEIASIEVPNKMSALRARAWLEYYKNDELSDIEGARFKPSKEECEMVQRLASIEIDSRIPHDEKDEYTLQTMQALNIYTNSLFNFDKDVPYDLSVKGEAWYEDKDGNLKAAIIGGTTMASVDRLVWLGNDRDEHTLMPHLAAKFLGTTKDDEPTSFYVPISIVKHFRSYRYNYFIGYDT